MIDPYFITAHLLRGISDFGLFAAFVFFASYRRDTRFRWTPRVIAAYFLFGALARWVDVGREFHLVGSTFDAIVQLTGATVSIATMLAICYVIPAVYKMPTGSQLDMTQDALKNAADQLADVRSQLREIEKTITEHLEPPPHEG